MLVEPRLLDEVISVTEAMWPNCRSRGVATEEAIVSGLAPGSAADTEIVGKSTCRQRRHGEQLKGDGPRQGDSDGEQCSRDGLPNKQLKKYSCPNPTPTPAPIKPVSGARASALPPGFRPAQPFRKRP